LKAPTSTAACTESWAGMTVPAADASRATDNSTRGPVSKQAISQSRQARIQGGRQGLAPASLARLTRRKGHLHRALQAVAADVGVKGVGVGHLHEAGGAGQHLAQGQLEGAGLRICATAAAGGGGGLGGEGS
jgi:hypothetical protein